MEFLGRNASQEFFHGLIYLMRNLLNHPFRGLLHIAVVKKKLIALNTVIVNIGIFIKKAHDRYFTNQ